MDYLNTPSKKTNLFRQARGARIECERLERQIEATIKQALVICAALLASTACDGGEFSNRSPDEPLPGTGGEPATESLASGATVALSSTGGASSAWTSQPNLPPVTGGQAATGGQSSTGGTSGLVATGGAATSPVSMGGSISTGGQAETGGFAAANTGSCISEKSCADQYWCDTKSGECKRCTTGYPKCACSNTGFCFAPYQCSAGICRSVTAD